MQLVVNRILLIGFELLGKLIESNGLTNFALLGSIGSKAVLSLSINCFRIPSLLDVMYECIPLTHHCRHRSKNL